MFQNNFWLNDQNNGGFLADLYDGGIIKNLAELWLNYGNLSDGLGNKELYLHPVETKVIFESEIKESTFVEEDILEKLNDRQKQFLKSGITNISRKEYSELVKCSIRTAFNDLQELLDKNIVKKIGGGKYVKYAIR